MFAFVVYHHHIAGFSSIDCSVPVKLDLLSVPDPVTQETAQTMGAMLLAENIRSVVYRYNLSGTGKESLYCHGLPHYRFQY